MKWYKHLSKSLNNPFIKQLMYEFGSDAYLVFFGTLEIYSDNYIPSERYELRVKTRFLRDELLLSNSKLQKILIKISQNPDIENRWMVNFHNDEVTIYIPKFKKMVDNYTQDTTGKTCNKLPRDLEETFQPIRIKNKEEEKEEDNIKAQPEKLPPVDNPPQKESPFDKELRELYFKIQKTFPNFQIQKFFQIHHKKHPEAIIKTFQRLIAEQEAGNKIDSVWSYAEKIIIEETKNFNARDSENQNNDYKKYDLSSVGSIFKKIAIPN